MTKNFKARLLAASVVAYNWRLRTRLKRLAALADANGWTTSYGKEGNK